MTSLGVALVTGASRGIGRAIALRLAKDGFDVAVNDLPSAKEQLNLLRKEIEGVGGKGVQRRAYVAVGDVSVQSNVEDMVGSVVGELGQLNVMVANAGICRAHPITETEVGEWDQLFSTNSRGAFLCYKYAAMQMIKQGTGGRIIGASSDAGRQGAASMAAYCATKFAIRGLTQVAALEWAKHGITVNAYCPGAIKTDILKDIYSSFAPSLEELHATFSKLTPVGYIGTTTEVASLVSYLASKEAHFITGQSIGVDGGFVMS